MVKFPAKEGLMTAAKIFLGLIIAGFYLNLAACSLEEKGLRQIRAHVAARQGVAHAVPMHKAERYCKNCHGQNLSGGTQGEPSCYTCHGRLWLAYDPEISFAPSDHTLIKGAGFRHHPGIDQVRAVCTSCHGLNLLGEGEDGTPSCLLCHDKVWEN